MFARIYLFVQGATFALYGAACLFSPEMLGGFSGLGMDSASALTETRAMYGGLQIAIGLIFLRGAAQAEAERETLIVSLIMFGCLAGGRSIGLALDGLSGGYNNGAVGYEITSTLLSAYLVSRSASPAASRA